MGGMEEKDRSWSSSFFHPNTNTPHNEYDTNIRVRNKGEMKRIKLLEGRYKTLSYTIRKYLNLIYV